MSIKTSERVWNESKQKGGALLLLLAIADSANRETDLAWPGVDLLARMTRLGSRHILRLIKHLEQSGELLVYRRDGYHNFYIVITGLEKTEVDERIEALSSMLKTPLTRDILSPPTRDSQVTGTRDILSPPPVTPRSRGPVTSRSPDPLFDPEKQPLPEPTASDEAGGAVSESPSPFKRMQETIIDTFFGGNWAQAARAGDLAHMLLGTSDKKSFQPYNVDPPTTPDEVRAVFVDDYPEDLALPTSPAKINQRIFDYRQEHGISRASPRVNGRDPFYDPRYDDMDMYEIDREKVRRSLQLMGRIPDDDENN